ncbi:uncharacterized protein L203_101056 [Cryptococcus depauperatus CBS 7841]|uniref:Uncharacterized protein n=1 Tax=Cryptococcus depauperatus CBS 7841 TaxID=1295531 RepID=A0AAJ8LZ21_9TREE
MQKRPFEIATVIAVERVGLKGLECIYKAAGAEQYTPVCQPLASFAMVRLPSQTRSKRSSVTLRASNSLVLDVSTATGLLFL